MTTGTIALLAWFRQSTNGGPSMTNTMTSGPSTTRKRNAPPRKYVVHMRRTCFKCKQEGHYARDCPHIANQKPAETKMEKIQALLRSMTTTERTEFKKHVLKTTDELRTRTTEPLLSRETSPHTDRMFTEPSSSGGTNLHTRQMPKQFAETPERCEECDGAHPTRICMKRFLKTRNTELVLHPTRDNDSTGSDTLCDSKGLEDGEIKPTTDLLIHPIKTVAFDLLNDESGDDNDNDDDSVNTQQPTSQNDEADARL